MNATDELRAELTRRGVEWKAPSSYDGSNRYDTVAGGYWFHEFDGKITIHGLTPAQAIAATLGAWTLTAEQVSRATYAHSIHADCADADWQAIADELNATLGSEDTYTREDVEGAFVSGYSLGLDMFDSSKPDSEKGWNQNERDMEEEMEDLGWVRKDSATLGPTDPRERGLIPHFWTGDWTLHIEAARLPERIDVTLPDQRGREVYSARVHHFVPERTCHIEQTGHVKVAGVDYYDDDYECSECGAEMFEGYSFCPNCGRKVVGE